MNSQYKKKKKIQLNRINQEVTKHYLFEAKRGIFCKSLPGLPLQTLRSIFQIPPCPEKPSAADRQQRAAPEYAPFSHLFELQSSLDRRSILHLLGQSSVSGTG